MAKEKLSTQQNEVKVPPSSGRLFFIDPNKRGAALRVFLAGVMALILFSVVINSYVQLNEVYTEISAANTQLGELRSENVRMQTELEGKASISNIKDYAEQYLGLQQLEKSQIQYIQSQTEDEVVIDAEQQNIFVTIKHWFEDLVAYLRG